MTRGGVERVQTIAGVKKGVAGLAPAEDRPLRISSRELLQVGERVAGKRLPLLVIKWPGGEARNERVLRMWRIPGTDVRVSPQGDIFYPVWRERTRILNPELYVPCSRLPKGWTFERLLASQRRPISEVVFHEVKKQGGGVEVAIRNMDHVLEKYRQKGEELEQVEIIQGQIDQAMRVLQETKGVSAEEFQEGFDILYQQTLDMMEKSGMTRARSALKRNIERLLGQVSTGKDRLGRRNPGAMLKRLEAAARRVGFRRNEAGFIVDKFEAMKAGLVAQAGNDRGVLTGAQHELTVGIAAHEAFRFQTTSALQRGILVGKLGTLIYSLERIRVKPYKPIASELVNQFGEAQQMIRNGDYQGATAIFQRSLKGVVEVLG